MSFSDRIVSHFSFLTISLCMAGNYLRHPVFPILCHVFSQLVFLHVSLYVFPPSLFRPTSAPSPQNVQVLAISHRCGWVLASSSDQNAFELISMNVSTGFTCASFLMSSFLMWSNLVFPLAHLNILISAEFNLLSSFFLTTQHLEACVIAGLMIVEQ